MKGSLDTDNGLGLDQGGDGVQDFLLVEAFQNLRESSVHPRLHVPVGGTRATEGSVVLSGL